MALDRADLLTESGMVQSRLSDQRRGLTGWGARAYSRRADRFRSQGAPGLSAGVLMTPSGFGLREWVRKRRTIRSADAEAEDIQHQRGLG